MDGERKSKSGSMDGRIFREIRNRLQNASRFRKRKNSMKKGEAAPISEQIQEKSDSRNVTVPWRWEYGFQ